MFRKKEKIKSFDENGQEISEGEVQLLEDTPAKIPDLDLPTTAHVNYEACFICGDRKYYKDATGVWHNCVRCNKKNLTSIGGD